MKNLKRVLSLLLCLIMVVGLVPTTAFAATHPYLTKAPQDITLAPGESKAVSIISMLNINDGNAWISTSGMTSDAFVSFGAKAGEEVTPYTFSYDASKAGTEETYWLIFKIALAGGANADAQYVSFTVTYLEAATPTTYTVTFDSNGGSAVTAQTVESGKTATEPTAPTKEGYTFKGWTLDGVAYDFATPVTGDITLTAKWEVPTATFQITKFGEGAFVGLPGAVFHLTKEGESVPS